MSILRKSAHFNEQGDYVIPVIGVPFTGPVDGKKDLVGDYFDESTDLGGLPIVYTYFDHRLSPEYIKDEQLKNYFGNNLLGYAHKGDLTPEGQVYNIIVDRRSKYLNMIKKLIDDGLIDVSSKASFRYPEEPGLLKTWHVEAVDFTPSPMNLNATIAVMKSVIMEEEDVTKTKKADESEVVEETKATDVVEETEPTEVENSKTSITDAIKSIVKSTDVEEDAQNGSEGNPQILALVQTVQKSISNLEKQINDLREDLETALPSLGDIIAKSIRGEVEIAVTDQRSKVEKSVASDIAKKQGNSKQPVTGPVAGKLPSNAPGVQ